MKRRVISVGLVMLFVFSMCIFPASAEGIGGIQDSVLQPMGMNELNARIAINSYFAQRLSYLCGTTEDISVVNRPMLRDEEKHRAVLVESGIVLQSSVPSILSVECWDGMAIAVVQETAQFLQNGNMAEEIISHEITLCCVENGQILLQSDAYIESVSGFESCSYLSPDIPSAEEIGYMVAGGTSCITEKALSQQNKADPTPYYDWYEVASGNGEHGNDWCAIFVAWCAGQCSISASIIPCHADVPYFRTFYHNWNESLTRYYDWQAQLNKKAQGQAYQWPQPGDLVFINGDASSPQHIGIIYYVSGEVLYIVDGNWNGKVNYRAVPDTNSSIVAFAKPAYATASHTVSALWTADANYHWNACGACGKVFNKDIHRPLSTWRSDMSYHWHACATCGQGQLQKAGHTMQWDNIYLEYRCTVCGYNGPPYNG